MVRFAAAAAALVLAAYGSTAQAGLYGDDLSKCLVKASSPQDRNDMVLWIYGAMSLHPEVKPYSKLTTVQHDAVTKKAAALTQRLLTVDCRKETIDALRYEGPATMQAAFGVLGQVAMADLMSDQQVAQGMSNMGTYLDTEKLEALGAEAGGMAGVQRK
ncbi:hypothetical protein LJR164_003784 [Phenylobacterium sp. LjRoot164]|uniref:hypothetical protein n=1 Tax=unclassified Phenylobacterium TaxID=2640670 RepID=UPI003ECFEB89